MNYYGAPIALSSHNAESHGFAKDAKVETISSAIFWKSDQEKYFRVIGLANKAYSSRLAAENFKDTVSSGSSTN